MERDKEPVGLRASDWRSAGHWPANSSRPRTRRWQLLRDAPDLWLRFRVECYLWDRAEGKPAQANILADNRESVGEVELGDLPMPAVEPGKIRKRN